MTLTNIINNLKNIIMINDVATNGVFNRLGISNVIELQRLCRDYYPKCVQPEKIPFLEVCDLARLYCTNPYYSSSCLSNDIEKIKAKYYFSPVFGAEPLSWKHLRNYIPQISMDICHKYSLYEQTHFIRLYRAVRDFFKTGMSVAVLVEKLESIMLAFAGGKR